MPKEGTLERLTWHICHITLHRVERATRSSNVCLGPNKHSSQARGWLQQRFQPRSNRWFPDATKCTPPRDSIREWCQNVADRPLASFRDTRLIRLNLLEHQECAPWCNSCGRACQMNEQQKTPEPVLACLNEAQDFSNKIGLSQLKYNDYRVFVMVGVCFYNEIKVNHEKMA